MNSIRHNALLRTVQRLNQRLQHLERVNRRFSTARLVTALITIASVILALTLEQSAASVIIPLVSALVFTGLVVRHNRLKQQLRRFQLWEQIKRTHIARMTLEWDHLPPAIPAEPQPDHPFETDLDITGERSLHHLLDTTVTREGSDRLRAWLLTTAPDVDEILRRQALVRELKRLPNFCDKLALYGIWRGARHKSYPHSWLEGKNQVDTRVLTALCLFALLNLLLLVADVFGIVAPIWRFTIPAYFIAFLFAARSLGDIFQDSLAIRDRVETFNAVFRYLETARYSGAPHLEKLCAPFLDPATRPTRQLVWIRWLLFFASLRSNVILWLPLNLFLPWDMLVAWGLDRVRNRLRHLMPRWLGVWFELEAVAALATYARLHPAATFPTLEGNAVFAGSGLGHPLIHEAVKVRNDFALSDASKLVIITGSNMSGKSSFLRTVGLALSMAYAGGVVDAASLRLSPFRLRTCIRVSDSVIEGFSYFYAEVRRLKLMLDAFTEDAPYPVFFLIDEIFKGTNNRERLIGSRSYIRALTGKNGLGFISTHDLELVQLATEIPSIRNVHFREQVIDGQMVFDYKIHEGASPTTNALQIMRLAGLPIEAQD